MGHPDRIVTEPMEPAKENGWPERTALLLLLGCIAVLQLWLVFRLNINWDEYWYLSQIHAYNRGDLATPFQTVHVHLFSWLPAIPFADADQVIIGRCVMILCEIVTFAIIFDIARKLFSPADALFALIVYLCAGFVLAHGMSFRTDPLAAMLMMAGLWLMTVARQSWPVALVAGLAAAMALLVTVKSVLFLPTFGAALLYRLNKRRLQPVLVFFVISAVAAIAIFALGWSLHSHSLASTPAPSASPTVSLNQDVLKQSAGQSFDKTVASSGFFPGMRFFTRWLAFGPGAGLIILGSLFLAAVHAIRATGPSRFVPLLFALPFASILFYRNAYPYFYPFILAPVALSVAFFSQQFSNPSRRRLLVILLVAGFAFQAVYYLRNDQSAQRSTARQVHAIFPEPVAYIDRNGMIPSFRKVGPFMSTWGMEGIMAKGEPVLARTIAQQRPPLVIANSPYLEAALDRSFPVSRIPMPADDVEALRDNYIHFWGPVWLAGMDLKTRGGATRFTITIAGTYTLHCAGSATLDGTARHCGETVDLSAGQHSLDVPSGNQVKLLWGNRFQKPSAPPPTKPIYYGF